MFSHLIINHVNKMINGMDPSSKNFFFFFLILIKKTAMNADIDSQNKYILFLSFVSVFIFPHIKIIKKLLLSDHMDLLIAKSLSLSFTHTHTHTHTNALLHNIHFM